MPTPLRPDRHHPPSQIHLPPTMPPREARKRRLTPLTIGLGVSAIGCFALAVGLWASSAISQHERAELSPIDDLVKDAELVTEDHDGVPLAEEDAPASDPWEGAEEAYPGLAAWLEVDGVGISTPVMQASEDAPDWFINHDAFGNESAEGLPYLDYRSAADGPLCVVYAHNLGWGSSEGFGALADTWQQERFEEIGTLRWADLGSQDPTSDGQSAEHEDVVEFRPICAIKVDGEESDLFDFELADRDIAKWLDGVTARADAITGSGMAGGALSDRYLALVTCSGDGYPSQSRTITVFGDADEVYFEGYGELLDGIEALASKLESSKDDGQ